MRILVDIGHPAHVYIFKNIALEMQKKGHSFLFTVRAGENEDYLLRRFGLTYIKIGGKKSSLFGKLSGLIVFTIRILFISIRFKPDLYLSHGSMYAGYASRIMGKPHIALEDSGNKEQLRFSLPVSDVILTPEALKEDYGKKQIRYNGYHELMYLTPKYFNPDNFVLELLKTIAKRPYAIIRFVAWKASHDRGIIGLTMEQKRALVFHIKSKGLDVLISSENDLPEELNQYRLNIPFEMVHHALAFATIYVGEGATMASEAGILGIPSLYVSPIRRCYNDEQEQYGTVYNYQSFEGLLTKIDSILSNPQTLENHKSLAQKLIEDKIEVTDFFIWFIENWPNSRNLTKSDTEYLKRFLY